MSEEDLNAILFFWEEGGDPTKFYRWDEILKENPELEEAYGVPTRLRPDWPNWYSRTP